LPAIPFLMILICVFLIVPIWSTSIAFLDCGIFHLCLPRFVSKYSQVLEKGNQANCPDGKE
jgi:hypothetical protein